MLKEETCGTGSALLSKIKHNQGTGGPGVGRAAGRGVGGAAASQPGLYLLFS